MSTPQIQTAFEDSGRHPQWPTVANAVIEADKRFSAELPHNARKRGKALLHALIELLVT